MSSHCRSIVVLLLLEAALLVYGSSPRESDLLTSRQSWSWTLCNESDAWMPTYGAWESAYTDQYLLQVFASRSEGERMDHALGLVLGDNDLYCGINSATDCSIPTCLELQNNGLQPWVYLAAKSFANLNAFFNTLHEGLNIGANDVGHLVDDMSTNLFKFKDPKFVGNDIAFWVGASLGAIAAWPASVAAENIAKIISTATGAFAGAAAAEAAESLRPVEGLTTDQGKETLNDVIANFSMIAREAVETWSNNTFAGNMDKTKHNILDYLQGGRFVDSSSIPSVSSVAKFYKNLLVARMLNMLWRSKPIYVVSTTADVDLKPSVKDLAYKSPASGRTYMAYYHKGGRAKAPPGLDALDGSFYDIRASQVAQSSAGSWEAAGYDYTSVIGFASLANSSDAFGPWQDQAGYQGVFTLPVCDIGYHADWFVPYKSKILPCCCGPNCVDTKDFMNALDLNKRERKSWRKACKKQLKGTQLNFGDIDYGK